MECNGKGKVEANRRLFEALLRANNEERGSARFYKLFELAFVLPCNFDAPCFDVAPSFELAANF